MSRKLKSVLLIGFFAIGLGAVAYIANLQRAQAVQEQTRGRVVQWAQNKDFRWIVVEGSPGEKIVHSVKTKSQVDVALRRTALDGPVGMSLSVNESKEKVPAYLSWYKITYGNGEKHGSWEIQDSVAPSGYAVALGPAQFFLSPAKRLTSGTPKKEPEDLDLFKAYEISNSHVAPIEFSIEHPIVGMLDRNAKPKYLCLPVEESHHAETFPIKKPNTCFVVYELDESKKTKSEFTLAGIDQFGLHRLAASECRFICVPAKVVAKK